MSGLGVAIGVYVYSMTGSLPLPEEIMARLLCQAPAGAVACLLMVMMMFALSCQQCYAAAARMQDQRQLVISPGQ